MIKQAGKPMESMPPISLLTHEAESGFLPPGQNTRGWVRNDSGASAVTHIGVNPLQKDKDLALEANQEYQMNKSQASQAISPYILIGPV